MQIVTNKFNVYEILSLISQNFKTSSDHDHAHPAVGCHPVTTNLIHPTCVQNFTSVASVIPQILDWGPKI